MRSDTNFFTRSDFTDHGLVRPAPYPPDPPFPQFALSTSTSTQIRFPFLVTDEVIRSLTFNFVFFCSLSTWAGLYRGYQLFYVGCCSSCARTGVWGGLVDWPAIGRWDLDVGPPPVACVWNSRSPFPGRLALSLLAAIRLRARTSNRRPMVVIQTVVRLPLLSPLLHPPLRHCYLTVHPLPLFAAALTQSSPSRLYTFATFLDSTPTTSSMTFLVLRDHSTTMSPSMRSSYYVPYLPVPLPLLSLRFLSLCRLRVLACPSTTSPCHPSTLSICQPPPLPVIPSLYAFVTSSRHRLVRSFPSSAPDRCSFLFPDQPST
ncbi:hypothetical protein B0H13DRAFT_1011048 [Mycena leptocephala]|nr:hypothetical protein B0H13DRAFT_1011048 [Mycena leptocephala]